MRKMIGPLGFEENDPVKIRRAFTLGCSGVVVAGSVPEDVSAEIAHFQEGFDEDASEVKNKFMIEYMRGYPLSLPEEPDSLRLTFAWLGEQMQWAFSEEGLRKEFPFFGRWDMSRMRIWLKNEFHTLWHTDTAKLQDSPDVHIHVFGAGLLIAHPQVPTLRDFTQSAGNLLPRHKGEAEGSAADLDRDLQEDGFQLVQLKPGEKLVFGSSCLHRSSDTTGTAMKLRAAIF